MIVHLCQVFKSIMRTDEWQSVGQSVSRLRVCISFCSKIIHLHFLWFWWGGEGGLGWVDNTKYFMSSYNEQIICWINPQRTRGFYKRKRQACNEVKSLIFFRALIFHKKITFSQKKKSKHFWLNCLDKKSLFRPNNFGFDFNFFCVDRLPWLKYTLFCPWLFSFEVFISMRSHIYKILIILSVLGPLGQPQAVRKCFFNRNLCKKLYNFILTPYNSPALSLFRQLGELWIYINSPG